MLPKLRRPNNCLERYNRRLRIFQMLILLFANLFLLCVRRKVIFQYTSDLTDIPSSEAFHDWIQARIENYNVSFSSENKNNSKLQTTIFLVISLGQALWITNSLPMFIYSKAMILGWTIWIIMMMKW
jgi:hypothetical protein